MPVDVGFPLLGSSMPRDNAGALALALFELLPWLESDREAGVHPVKLAQGSEPMVPLSHRTRLVLRLPASRAAAAASLAGKTLRIGGTALRLGDPAVRQLQPHATLYARTVSLGEAGEATFLAELAAHLQARGINCHSVCGREQRFGAAGILVHGFSLLLHGLAEADSLRIQSEGLGAHRLFGCGIFVGHKSAAAVTS